MTGTIEIAREVVAQSQAVEVDGVLLDLQTANLIVAVAGRLNAANRDKLDCLPIDVAGRLCWRATSKGA